MMMWLNRITTKINVTLHLLYIYIYIYIVLVGDLSDVQKKFDNL